jgi:DNA-binding phage protein
VVVTHKRDTPEPEAAPTLEQTRVAQWFGGVVEEKEAQGWSRSKIADKAGLSRKDFYRYLDPAQAPKSPRSATIRRICEGLKVDYAVATEKLGWGKDGSTAGTPATKDLGEYIRRTRELAEHEGTSERRRRELLERVEAAEQSLRMAASNRLTAQQMERAAEALLRQVFEESDEELGH